jgi:hypothetical protein
MKINIALACSVLGVIAAASTASAQVQLSMQGGHVTLSAKNATIRQILAEWERVGETKIINAERSPAGLVTLELPDMPEQQALDIILRSASGALFAPRTEAAAGNRSAYAQIILMPPSIAPPPSAAPTPASPPFGQQTVYPQQMPFQQQPQPQFQQPQFQQPLQFQPPPPESDDDDRPTVAQPRPVFVFPQPQITNPQGIATPAVPAQPQSPQMMFPQGAPTNPPSAAFPGAPTATPGGVSVPGMMVPVPVPQPGQPGFVPQPQTAPPRTTP